MELNRVSILIGKDEDYAREVFEVRKPIKSDNKLKALRGPLGWVITGTVQSNQTHNQIGVHFTSCDKKLHDQVENFWNIEGFGTRSDRHIGQLSHNLSQEDRRAVNILEKTTKLTDGHYETGLLWKNEQVKLPNNRQEAERRLYSLRRKFNHSPDIEVQYRTEMNTYIEKGYARKLMPEEITTKGPRTWYLPHFAVTNPNKPGKVRIVFDAASEYEGKSLNKNLLQGPDCTNNLTGVLLRFREDNIAVVADIESMFHQVKVKTEDEDSLRFLWWSGSVDDPPEEYVMTVHIFEATDSPCSANSTLKRTAEDNANDFDPLTIKTLQRNFYVDDLLKSVPSPEVAIRLSFQMIELCARSGFNLTKFMSNDRHVLSQIPVEKRATQAVDLDLDLPVDSALGVKWNTEEDTFGLKAMDLNEPNTLRGVLSTICSVYDPLNFAAPAMMPAKQILQSIWRRKLPWDQALNGEVLQRWEKWKTGLSLLDNMTVTRCYFSRLDHNDTKLQLHHFCDASELGYCTASYSRIEYPDGIVESSFIISPPRLGLPICG